MSRKSYVLFLNCILILMTGPTLVPNNSPSQQWILDYQFMVQQITLVFKMQVTPSINFTFQDSHHRTPLMTRDNLSFRLSASNPHHNNQHNNPHHHNNLPTNPNPHSTPSPNRCLLRDLKPDTDRHKNTSQPAKHGSVHIDRLPTDEFFDHFDRLFKVKFVSPEKGDDEEEENTRVPTKQVEEERKVEKLIEERQVESCTLGQQQRINALESRFVQQHRTHRATFNRKLVRPNTTKHYTKATAIDRNQMSLVQNHNKKSIFSRKSQGEHPLSMTIKRKRYFGDALHVNINCLNTIINKGNTSNTSNTSYHLQNHCLKSGTLQNWKRKFHEKQRSKQSDGIKTVKSHNRKKPKTVHHQRPNIFRMQDQPRMFDRLFR